MQILSFIELLKRAVNVTVFKFMISQAYLLQSQLVLVGLLIALLAAILCRGSLGVELFPTPLADPFDFDVTSRHKGSGLRVKHIR